MYFCINFIDTKLNIGKPSKILLFNINIFVMLGETLYFMSTNYTCKKYPQTHKL